MNEHYSYTDTTFPSRFETLLFPEVSEFHGDLLGRVYGQQYVQIAEKKGLSVAQLKNSNAKTWRLPRGGDPGTDVLRSFGLLHEKTIPKDMQTAIRKQAEGLEFSVLDHQRVGDRQLFEAGEINFIWESFIEKGSTIIGLIGQILANSSHDWHTFIVAAPTAMTLGMKRLSQVRSELQKSGRGELLYHTMIQIEQPYQIPDHGGIHQELRSRNLITLGKSFRDSQ